MHLYLWFILYFQTVPNDRYELKWNPISNWKTVRSRNFVIFVTNSHHWASKSDEVSSRIQRPKWSSSSWGIGVFELAIGARNSVSHDHERIRVSSKYWIVSMQSMQMKSVRKPSQNGNKFELHLRLTCLNTRSETAQLVEYVPSNHVTRMLEFHDSWSSRFSLAACVSIPAWNCAGLYHMTCTQTHHSYLRSRRDNCWPKVGYYLQQFYWLPYNAQKYGHCRRNI